MYQIYVIIVRTVTTALSQYRRLLLLLILANFIEKFSVVRLEVFMAVKIQVEVLGAVTPCNVVVGYQRFRGPCCLSEDGGSVDL
jgi:hypothetical protein